MNYKIAVYTTDYLLLLELSEAIEREFPAAETMIFADAAFEKNFLSSGGDIITDFSRICEADILITLSDPAPILKEIEKFEGTVIDSTGSVFPQNAEVYKADEPVKGVLKNLAVPTQDVSAVAQLPVCVYGKNGVEDLMRQTKEIFSFENGDNVLFEQRIAFNVHFNPENLAGLPVGKSLEAFYEAGGEVSARIYPLSTVFIIDVYAKDIFGLKSEEGYKIVDGFFTVSDISECGDIFVIQRRNGYTFAGDYIRVLVQAVIKKLSEVTGQ